MQQRLSRQYEKRIVTYASMRLFTQATSSDDDAVMMRQDRHTLMPISMLPCAGERFLFEYRAREMNLLSFAASSAGHVIVALKCRRSEFLHDTHL